MHYTQRQSNTHTHTHIYTHRSSTGEKHGSKFTFTYKCKYTYTSIHTHTHSSRTGEKHGSKFTFTLPAVLTRRSRGSRRGSISEYILPSSSGSSVTDLISDNAVVSTRAPLLGDGTSDLNASAHAHTHGEDLKHSQPVPREHAHAPAVGMTAPFFSGSFGSSRLSSFEEAYTPSTQAAASSFDSPTHVHARVSKHKEGVGLSDTTQIQNVQMYGDQAALSWGATDAAVMPALDRDGQDHALDRDGHDHRKTKPTRKWDAIPAYADKDTLAVTGIPVVGSGSLDTNDVMATNSHSPTASLMARTTTSNSQNRADLDDELLTQAHVQAHVLSHGSRGREPAAGSGLTPPTKHVLDRYVCMCIY